MLDDKVINEISTKDKVHVLSWMIRYFKEKVDIYQQLDDKEIKGQNFYLQKKKLFYCFSPRTFKMKGKDHYLKYQ